MNDDKSWMYLGDSFEGKQALLSDAVDRWMDQMFPSAMTCGWVEATYPNFAVVGVAEAKGFDGEAHVEYWKLPYQIDTGDESVTLGEPKALDIRGVAVDRPDDAGDDILFLPRENVVAKALAFKSATRQRRHYALLAHSGVDIRPAGITPEMLAMAPNGTSSIPGEGMSDYRSGQSDLTTPGTVSDVPGEGMEWGAGRYNDHAGNMGAPALPEWFQGTYYVDNESNLVPVSMPKLDGPDYLSGVGNMSGSPMPAQGNYLDHANSNLPRPAGLTAVGQSRDAGTMTLAGRKPGERKSLLAQVKGQRYRIPGAPVADPGSGAPSAADARLAAAMPVIAEKAAALAVACKEGRMMSGSNAERLASLHSELGKALREAGAPIDVFSEMNQTSGMNEDGQPIPVGMAKGLPVEMLMAADRMRAEVEQG